MVVLFEFTLVGAINILLGNESERQKTAIGNIDFLLVNGIDRL